MAATAAAYGLIPVKRADGMAYAGAVTQYLIDPAGEATNIYHGQVVHIGTDGYIAMSTGTGADGTTNAFPVGTTLYGSIGVFMGCEYVNTEGQTIHSQYYPTGLVAPSGTDIKAFVVDDPRVLFKAQLDGSAAQADIGDNTFFSTAQTTALGSTRTGNSTSALDATTKTVTAAFRIVSAYSPIGDDFPDVLVIFNPGWHSLNAAVAAS